MEERFICHTDRCPNGKTTHKNSTIVELPNGDLLAAWFATEYQEGHRGQNIYGSRLPAGEDNWEPFGSLVKVDRRALGGPVLFMGPGDDLWLLVPQMYGTWPLTSRIFYKRSPDLGQKWNDLELLSEVGGLYPKNKPLHLEDDDRWILGVSISHGSENKSGMLVLPHDTINRPGDFPCLVGGDQIVSMELNDDGYDKQGDTMETRGMVYPTPVELENGTLLAYMMPRPGGYLYETRSHDQGYNWTSAEETNIPNPNAGFDVLMTDAGNLVLVNNPVAGERLVGRNELAVFMSEDEGKTWPYQLYLENEEIDGSLAEMPQVGRPEFTYGNVIQGHDGTLHFSYEYRRSAIKHVALTETEIQERGSETVIVEDIIG